MERDAEIEGCFVAVDTLLNWANEYELVLTVEAKRGLLIVIEELIAELSITD